MGPRAAPTILSGGVLSLLGAKSCTESGVGRVVSAWRDLLYLAWPGGLWRGELKIKSEGIGS